jgi:hypothetical protein
LPETGQGVFTPFSGIGFSPSQAAIQIAGELKMILTNS